MTGNVLDMADKADLVGFVTEKLREHGHPNPEAWQVGLHEHSFAEQPFDIQRMHVNRRLIRILTDLERDHPENISTMKVRFCLPDTGTSADWKRLFVDGVLSCFISYQLPYRGQ